MFVKRLPYLKSVVRVVELNVVEWGTYGAICNNYRIIEIYLQMDPIQTEEYKDSTSHPDIIINDKIWLRNIKENYCDQ